MASGIGHLLREARYGKGITLSDAAARTGVRETHLLAIERDELEAIGVEPAYMRGILRTYADYLELDTDALLARYDSALPPTQRQVAGPEVTATRARRPTRRHIGAAVGATLMVLTLAGATVAVLVLRGGTRDRDAVAGGLTTDTAVTASEAPDTVASQEAAASESGSEDALVLDIPPGPTPEGLTMKLEFTDTVWIRVLVDGKNKLEGIMRPGAVTQFTGKDKIELRIGVAEAVEFSLNGAWYGNIASTRRGPINVTCTPETSCRVTQEG